MVRGAYVLKDWGSRSCTSLLGWLGGGGSNWIVGLVKVARDFEGLKIPFVIINLNKWRHVYLKHTRVVQMMILHEFGTCLVGGGASLPLRPSEVEVETPLGSLGRNPKCLEEGVLVPN